MIKPLIRELAAKKQSQINEQFNFPSVNLFLFTEHLSRKYL